MLNWTPFAIPGVLVLVVGLALAGFVFRSRPDRFQNRILALQVVAEAVSVSLISGVAWLFDSARVVEAMGIVSICIVWPKLWTYYSFLSTLDTPLARPLRRGRLLDVMLGLGLVGTATVLAWPEWYIAGAARWPAVDAIHVVGGSAFLAMFWLWSLMWLVGLTFSISALRQARTPIQREQARAYLLAFGFRDIGFVLMAVLITVVPPTWAHYHWMYLMFPATYLVYYPLVGWGILQHQLFDIELKLKRGIERSLVLGVIAAAFFVGAEALENVLSVDSFLLGIVPAALATAAIRPLHRVAQRMADRLMPGVEPTPAYLDDRREEVYRNAVEAALQDGAVSERERAIMMRLRESLGVDAPTAERIEREVAATLEPAEPGAARFATT